MTPNGRHAVNSALASNRFRAQPANVGMNNSEYSCAARGASALDSHVLSLPVLGSLRPTAFGIAYNVRVLTNRGALQWYRANTRAAVPEG